MYNKILVERACIEGTDWQFFTVVSESVPKSEPRNAIGKEIIKKGGKS